MRKLGVFILSGFAGVAMLACSNYTHRAAYAEEKIVCVGGMAAGFTLKSGGVQIIGMCEIITDNGTISPALKAGLRPGDRIISVNGIRLESIEQLNELTEKSHGDELRIEVARGGETFTITLRAAKDKATNRYKIGILARDSVSGIGTITYIDKKSGRFGALGHAVLSDAKQELKIADGGVFACSVVGVSKGVRGKAGELRGLFLNSKTIGKAEKISNCGIFGTVSNQIDVEKYACAVADSYAATPGAAIIYSTIDGEEVKAYDIEIVKVDKNNKDNKNYVLKIVDEELIENAGGIVQGMSGSPILQNGKLIGAVTHVFLNDPTRGYGIDINVMMRE